MPDFSALPDRQPQRARAALRYAVRTGRLVRPSACSSCGVEGKRIHGHHHNGYSPEHALDVVWLCSRCHHKADAESHERGRQARIGVAHSPERRAAISAAAKGRLVTAEQRAKISRAMAGRYVSPEHRARISAALKGRKPSAGTLAKLSAARKGRVISPEWRAKLAEATAGEKHPNAKLTESDIRAIRALHDAGLDNAAIARQYGVYTGTIWRIVAGKGWRHVV